MPGNNLDIRRDIAETRVIVSEVRRNVDEIQHILQSREDKGGKNWTVSNIRTI